MTQQLETDLSRAFSLRSSGVPADAGARLRNIDYHPRTSRIPPWVTLGSLAGIATATGAVVSVAVLASAQPAFAGWTASPAPASAVKSTGAGKVCRAQLARSPGMPGAAPVSGWHAVTSDVRGPFTLVIYQGGGTDATCLTGPAITVVFAELRQRGLAVRLGNRWRETRKSGDELDRDRRLEFGQHQAHVHRPPRLHQPGSLHVGRGPGRPRSDGPDPVAQ